MACYQILSIFTIILFLTSNFINQSFAIESISSTKFLNSISNQTLQDITQQNTTNSSISLEQKFKPEDHNDHARDRVFAISTDEPLANILRNDEISKKHLRKAVQLFRNFTTLMDNRIKNDHPLACNLEDDHEWLKTSTKTMSARQIGKVNERCNTRVNARIAVHNKELSSSVLTDSRNIIINARHSLFTSLSSIKRMEDFKNRSDLFWHNGTFEMKDWQLERSNQRCELNRLSMYHVNESFYYYPEMTNNPVDALMADYQRQGILEFVKEDFSKSLKLVHPWYNITKQGINEDGFTQGLNVSGTTIIGRWAGRASLASVGIMSFDTNPAIKHAFDANMKHIEIASDSVTYSNIAILALPMLMTLIPITFITEFSTFGIFTYVIFTDICSIIPFLIKGIELILASTTQRDEIFAYRAGDMKMGQTEIWVASCKGKDDFKKIGILFVISSIGIMIIGLLTEFYAHRYSQRKRKRLIENLIAQGFFDHDDYDENDSENSLKCNFTSNMFPILTRSVEDTYEEEQNEEFIQADLDMKLRGYYENRYWWEPYNDENM